MMSADRNRVNVNYYTFNFNCLYICLYAEENILFHFIYTFIYTATCNNNNNDRS